MPGDALSDLELVLESEREFLHAGDLAALQNTLDAKEKLLQEMEQESLADSPRLQNLKKTAERNSALLEAASRGLRSALDRLQEIRKAGRTFETYSAHGCVRDVLEPAPTMSRRA